MVLCDATQEKVYVMLTATAIFLFMKALFMLPLATGKPLPKRTPEELKMAGFIQLCLYLTFAIAVWQRIPD